MANILYLVHRMPYPPNKGDKVRSYHLLRHLTQRHRVHLGTFIDDPADEKHVDTLRGLCGQAGVPVLVDFVDVDSAKRTDCAPQHRWPLSWLYRRQGRRLLACEREVCAQAWHGFFATEKEIQLFVDRASEAAGRMTALNDGVDANYFSPRPDRASPFPPGDLPVVFTGAMDYWPNVDAVTWFAREALPVLRRQWPGLRFFILGRAPTAAVQALAGEGVGRPGVAARGCGKALHAEPGVDVISAATSDGFLRAARNFLSSPRRVARVVEAEGARVLRCFCWAARTAALKQHTLAMLPRASQVPAQVLQ